MNYSPDLISSAMKMFAALAVLLAVLLAVRYISKRMMGRTGGQFSGGMIRMLGQAHVGVKKTITMVEVPGAVLVLGVTNDHIRLLTKIEDQEILDQFKAPDHRITSGSFLDQLRNLTLKTKKGADEH